MRADEIWASSCLDFAPVHLKKIRKIAFTTAKQGQKQIVFLYQDKNLFKKAFESIDVIRWSCDC